MYADDILIIAHSTTDCQSMLNIITKYGVSHQVKFNPTKTFVLAYNVPGNTELNLMMCDQLIIRSKCIKYLGCQIEDSYSNLEHIQKRKKAAVIGLANLYSTEVLNDQMNIKTKMRLFQIYIRPLILHGLETLTLTIDEMNRVKRIEGTLIKQIIGIAKYCHSTHLYNALRIHKTHDTINLIQYKFLFRIQNSKYLNEFLIECRKLKINSGLIGKIISSIGLNEDIDMNKLNEAMKTRIINLERQLADRHLYNIDTQEIKEILLLGNNKYRSFLLNKRLRNIPA
jgi:hypothetical protein